MDNILNQDLYAEAMKKALKVDFISSSWELKLYAVALYNASIWGRKIDMRNLEIRRKDKSLK